MTDKKQFSELKVIEIMLGNGATDYGRTKFVPFEEDDFGGKYIKYKDVQNTWHNLRADAIIIMRIYSAETFDDMIKKQNAEEETPADFSTNINDNVTIEEEDKW